MRVRAGRADRADIYPYSYHFFSFPAGLYIATHTPIYYLINIYISVISALPALISAFIGVSERADIGQIFNIRPNT